MLQWEAHLPRLFSHFLAAFEVPVGTATASSPIARHSSMPSLGLLRLTMDVSKGLRVEQAGAGPAQGPCAVL